MQISVTDAKAQLTELVRRAEAADTAQRQSHTLALEQKSYGREPW